MKKPLVKMTIIKEDEGYSASSKVGHNFIATQGDSYSELQNNILEAVNLAFEDKGFTYKINEIEMELDLESFFSYFKVINTKELSDWVGIKQSNLSDYIQGRKKPTTIQKQRILKGIEKIGRELSEIRMLL